ncbi:hypothetical protein G4H71_15515 [Rhodococcus triatomae]|uniref:Uncharacterized protein n=1 Tax=Rhodococcus triatomae TaxID=300028 RepID=A0A1G8J2X9_9NOCA|nr:hypothetical protein [Rhodococcus triatomae]QNG19826.1 hypothetical protein G4H72_14855 [Rhodococcus triatomae]QNG24258.1 hypothetical protein G4H71_15515 [Rhodococcus triatomae]SDI25599.1 hypothetical protein SAMN05444695_10650 [Rhodococcus triatomae]
MTFDDPVISRRPEMFTVPGRGATVRGTDGTFLRVTVAGADRSDDVAGAVARHDAEVWAARWSHRCPPIRLDGAHPVLDTIADALVSVGVTVVRNEDTGPAAGLVIRCATPPYDTPAPPREETSLPVLDITVEERLVLVGPLRLDATDASPSEVRRRRYAAAAAGPELEHWHRHASPSGTTLSTAATVLATGRVLDVVRAWRSEPARAARLRYTLWRHDDVRLETSEHVVLGFDEPAPRP